MSAINFNFLQTGSQWSNSEIQNLGFNFASSTNPLWFLNLEFLANFDPLTSGFSFTAPQEDIVRFLLLTPSEVQNYTGPNQINATLVNSVNYRTSFSDVIMSGFSEDINGEVQLVNHQGQSSSSLSLAGLAGSGTSLAGDIIINSLDVGFSQTQPGEAGFWLHLHEFGHAIGGFEDVINTAQAGGQFDSMQYTIMSFNPLNGVYASGLQLLDIAALQDTYGTRNYTTRAGNTEYKLGQGLGFSGAQPDDAFLYTIWDGNGDDTIDASDFTMTPQGAIIDLRQGEFSSIGNDAVGGAAIDNVAIAYYTVIENAIGTDFSDIIIGNKWNNRLEGGAGDDRIFGEGAAVVQDSVVSAIKSSDDGFMEVDPSSPSAPVPESDDDVLIGGEGNDFIYGGSGSDTLDYSGDSGTGVINVDLDNNGDGTVTDGFGDTDTVFGIENLILGNADDVINLGGPVGRTVDAGGGILDRLNYTEVYIDNNASGGVAYYDQETKFQDTLMGVETVTFDQAIIAPDFDQNTNLFISTNVLANDYSAHVGSLDFDFSFFNTFDTTNIGGTTFYEGSRFTSLDVDLGGGVTHTGNFGFAGLSPSFFGLQQQLNLVGGLDAVTSINGTNSGDEVTITATLGATFDLPPIYFYGGTGNDTVMIGPNVNDLPFIGVGFRGGNDTVTNANFVDQVAVWEGISQSESTVTQVGNDLVIDAGIKGSITLENTDINTTSIIWLENTATSIRGTQGDDLVTDFGTLGQVFALLDGDDFLDAGTGDDTVSGGLGDDIIIGGEGDDTLSGDDGDDSFILGASGANNDTVDGGSGNDTAVLSGDFTDYTSSTATGNLVFTEVAGLGNSFTFSNVETIQFDDGVYDVASDVFTGSTTNLLNPDMFTVPQDSQNFVLDVLGNDDPSVTEISGFDQPLNGTLTLNSDNTLSYSTSNYVGPDSFTYYYRNASGVLEQETVTIDVAFVDPYLGTNDDDVLVGDAGANFIRGLAGNDILDSQGGADTLEGGSGADFYTINDLTLGATINDVNFSGSGAADQFENILRIENPNLTFANFGSNFFIAGGSDLVIQNGFGQNHVTITNPLDFGTIVLSDGSHISTTELIFFGLPSTPLVTTTASDDNITISSASTAGPKGFDLQAGNDTFTATNRDEFIKSGDGNDIVNARGGDDIIYGDLGNDNLRGGSGNDILDGGDGNDFLNGEQGDDILRGGAGSDSVQGGDGNNFLYGGDGNDFLGGGLDIDFYDGGNGNDRVSFSFNLPQGVHVDLSQNLVLNDGNGNVEEIYNVESLQGTNQNDILIGTASTGTLTGFDGDDILEGGAGDSDFLFGGSGNDIYRYDALDGDDVIEDSSGNDTIEFGSNISQSNISLLESVGQLFIFFNNQSTDSLFVRDHFTSGNEIESLSFADGVQMTLVGGYVVTGTDQDNTLAGTVFDETVNAGLGDDTILASEGNDTINGNNGFDTVIYAGAFANYTVTRTSVIDNVGNDGSDTLSDIERIEFSDGFFENGVFTPNGNSFVATAAIEKFAGGAGFDTVDYSLSTAGISVNIEGVGSGGFAQGDTYSSIERLVGSAFDDTLFGESGNDTLEGLDGNDILSGDDGSDILYGGAGEDKLYGGDGSDTIYGGDDNDYITGSDGSDTLYGGQGNDTILGGGDSGRDVIFGDEGDDDINGVGGNDMLNGGSGSDTIRGELGNDILEGGAGLDNLYGGPGSDTFVFSSGSTFDASDFIHDFSLAWNDALDISDILIGYDPLTDLITDFVRITDNGTNSSFTVDADGGADNFVQIATLLNVTGLTDEEALETSGNLITS